MNAETSAAIEAMHQAATNVSDRIDALLADPKADAADVRAELQALADYLDALGKSPSSPVPLLPVVAKRIVDKSVKP